jgi:predicted CXXCH cytochrome family protein
LSYTKQPAARPRHVSNPIVKLSTALFGVRYYGRVWSVRALAIFSICLCAQTLPQSPPEQPSPFSHKLHADARLECAVCHPNANPGKNMGIAGISVCVTCHRNVRPQSQDTQKLTTLAKGKHGIEWVRVYQIPSFVRFSHRLHMAAGNQCEECHGPVATRSELGVERDLTQIGCVACHRTKHASIECTFCHE